MEIRARAPGGILVSDLVSILIPCHNAARHLAETLDSVVAQTWPHIETLVVDDGSKDDSVAVASAYAEHGVTVVTQPPRGAAAARNHALAIARGRWVKFLDADDLLSPNAVEAQMRALAGDCDALAHGAWARFVKDPAEADFTPRAVWHDSENIVDWLCEAWADGQPMFQCGMFLIPRETLELSLIHI